MKALWRSAIVLAITAAVAAGAYDLATVSTDYSAGGRPFVRIVSGPAGGTWYPLGAKMSQVFARDLPEVLSSSGPGGGIENVRDVNQRNAELGFSVSDAVYSGYRGLAKFRHPQSNVRHFATVYTNVFQIAVPRKSPIRSIADLKDKNISPGKAGWSGTAVAQSVLKAYGITFDSIKRNGGTVHHVDYSDSVALMKDGHIDAFLALSSVPQSSFMELDFEPGIRLLDIDEAQLRQVLAEIPGSAPFVIPKATYGSLERDVQTVGIPVVMIVHKDVSDDLAYRLVRSFWERSQDLVEVSPVWKSVTLESALLAATAPVHPGAQRYYDEMGVTPR
jgi:TRAP transporter TAXI family solute receptor